MATISEKIAALDSQRARLGARCGECGYDLNGDSSLYQITKALYKQATGWDTALQPGPYDYAAELRQLREKTAFSVNTIYGTTLDTNAATYAEIADAVRPLVAPEAAYAVTIPAATTGKYELRFLRSAEAPVVGGTYKGKAIAHVFSGFEDVAYSTNSKVPWYSLHADIAAVCFDDEVKPVSCAYWFYLQQNCTRYDLAKLDTSEATSFAYMFYSNTSLKALDVGSLATDSVTTAKYMLYNCTSLATLRVGSKNLRELTDMYCALRNLSSVTELDLSGCAFGTKATTAYQCFYGCSKLAAIYTPAGTDLSYVANSTQMFGYCRSLVGGAGTAWSSGSITAAMARVDGLGGRPGYFTAR